MDFKSKIAVSMHVAKSKIAVSMDVADAFRFRSSLSMCQSFSVSLCACCTQVCTVSVCVPVCGGYVQLCVDLTFADKCTIRRTYPLPIGASETHVPVFCVYACHFNCLLVFVLMSWLQVTVVRARACVRSCVRACVRLCVCVCVCVRVCPLPARLGEHALILISCVVADNGVVEGSQGQIQVSAGNCCALSLRYSP